MLNRTSRLDRRRIELSGNCSVHSGSRFILALHVNLEERVGSFEVVVVAANCAGDMAAPVARLSPRAARFRLRR